MISYSNQAPTHTYLTWHSITISNFTFCLSLFPSPSISSPINNHYLLKFLETNSLLPTSLAFTQESRPSNSFLGLPFLPLHPSFLLGLPSLAQVLCTSSLLHPWVKPLIKTTLEKPTITHQWYLHFHLHCVTWLGALGQLTSS